MIRGERKRDKSLYVSPLMWIISNEVRMQPFKRMLILVFAGVCKIPICIMKDVRCENFGG